ncbi:MAG: hypothetical protein NC117_01200 [Pseudoflavonifractor sp.]|nr:hypothetical protein [Pseudoflavonifractor sp.]
MKLKIFLTLIILGITSHHAVADSVIPHLVLHFHDNKQVRYPLNENPAISFTDTILTIQTDAATIMHPIDDIRQITYDNIGETGTNGVGYDKPDYHIEGDCILFSGLGENALLEIYTPQGHRVMSRHITQPDGFRLPTSDFGIGIFIIKINGLSIKIEIR